MFKKCDTFTREIKRGDIYYADLPYGEGHVQGGIRPVIVIQNDVGNRYSPTVIVAPLNHKRKETSSYSHNNYGKSQKCLPL